MIVNGNYQYFDFAENKPKLIEAFVSYYGEEFRERITYIINNINYHGYHSEEFVSLKYFELLKSHKTELTDIILKKYNLPHNGIRENIFLNQDDYPDFWKCLMGGQFVDTLDISDEEKEKIHNTRKLITEQFYLSNENPADNFLEILKFRKIYVDAVREIEKKYQYDVFQDIDLFDKQFTIAVDNFKSKAKEIGYIGDLSFFDTINPNENKMEEILFSGDLRVPGLVEAFTTNISDLIENTEEKNVDRLFYICKRLEYLSLIGVKFKYLDPVNLYNIESNESVDYILKEYEYQKSNMSISLKYKYPNIKNFDKLYSQGQFIPTEIADKLEEARNTEIAKLYNCCKFGENISIDNWIKKLNGDSPFDFFASSSFGNNKLYNVERDVYMCEDPIYLQRDFILNLIHEINHELSFGYKADIDSLYVREGADESTFDLKGSDVSKECTYNNDALIGVEEVWNELQAEKIAEIFFSQNPDYQIPNYGDGCQVMCCNYNNFYFLLKDLFDLYEEDIKRAKLDINYNFYKRHGLTTTKLQTYYEYYKSKIINKFKNTGVVDFYKVLELAYLCKYFEVEIMPKIDGMFSEELLDDEEFLKTISKETKDKILQLIESKKKIMRRIIKESPPQSQEDYQI